MWIVIRLVVMAIAIISRFIRQFEPVEQDSAGQCDAVPFYQETFLNKQKNTTGFELWYALQTDVPFQLNLESSASAFLNGSASAGNFRPVILHLTNISTWPATIRSFCKPCNNRQLRVRR